MKIGIVVPTIREECIIRFLNEWKKEFDAYKNLMIFVVEDNPQKSFNIQNKDVIHFSWEDIERELGEKAWIIPRRTDCVRSFGYYKAYQANVDMMITLDDDCYPLQDPPYLINSYIKQFENSASTCFFNTLSGRITNQDKEIYPRGFPYAGRNSKVALCHGLWSNVLDFDGITQLQMPDFRAKISEARSQTIPKDVFFTMCGMNVAVRREAIPAFYFLLMGKDKAGNRWGIDRFGDIWCGIFIKKIIDHLNMAVLSGQPTIHHDRASDAQKNFELESAGLPINEWLYKEVQKIELGGDNFKDCYRELAFKLPAKNEYFEKLKSAMTIWSELF